MNRATPLTPNFPFSFNPPSCSTRRNPALVGMLGLICLMFSPASRALTPAPDGGYANYNTAEGEGALYSLTTGTSNTATGSAALSYDTSGSYNTATGFHALYTNNGAQNTATGSQALYSNVNGTRNTATGANALHKNNTNDPGNTANDNTADGFDALFNNGPGTRNTATGSDALSDNFSGSDNTANGFAALLDNSTGQQNTAIGSSALQHNTAGTNTATGFDALFSNTSGPINTATGAYALYSNTTGQSNVATGVDALYHNQTGHDNTGDGFLALLNSKGSNNTALGSNAGASLTTGSNNIDIGANVLGVAGESGKIRIGEQGTQNGTFIAGIYGTALPGGVEVVVGSGGKLGVISSSARFKEAIKPMDKTSEAILALKPVTFRYKNELDPDGTPQFGLIAEEVEKVNPDLIVRDEGGKVMTVRYEAVNAMLLNEFLKEHAQVQELKAAGAKQTAIAQEQAATITELKKRIEVLTATVQKVSEEVALGKPAPQLVTNP